MSAPARSSPQISPSRTGAPSSPEPLASWRSSTASPSTATSSTSTATPGDSGPSLTPPHPTPRGARRSSELPEPSRPVRLPRSRTPSPPASARDDRNSSDPHDRQQEARHLPARARSGSLPHARDDKAAGEALRTSVVAPAQRSGGAQAKATTKQTSHGGPVHSFTTLLRDLATVVKNRVQPKADSAMAFDIVTRLTPNQALAFELLGVRCSQ